MATRSIEESDQNGRIIRKVTTVEEFEVVKPQPRPEARPAPRHVEHDDDDAPPCCPPKRSTRR